MSGIGCVGISIADDGIGCAHVDQSSGKPELVACEYRFCASKQNIDFEIENMVDELKLIDFPCVIALTPQNYQLFLVEAMTFSQDDKISALADRVKELLDYDASEAMIDYMPLPPSPADGKQMAYIVVAKQSEIDAQVEAAEGAGLNVRTVDIATCALRNIAVHLPGGTEGFFYLSLAAKTSQILLIRNGFVEMVRHFDVDASCLFPEPGSADEATPSIIATKENALVESIRSEVEKSKQYLESVLSQGPVSSLLLAPVNNKILNFIKTLEEKVGMSVRLTDLTESLETTESMIMEHQQRCLFAVGAALRLLHTDGSDSVEDL